MIDVEAAQELIPQIINPKAASLPPERGPVMDLNSAIGHALAESQGKSPCAAEHGQLAVWLTKLRETSDLDIAGKDAENARLLVALENEKHSRQVERGHTPRAT